MRLSKTKLAACLDLRRGSRRPDRLISLQRGISQVARQEFHYPEAGDDPIREVPTDEVGRGAACFVAACAGLGDLRAWDNSVADEAFLHLLVHCAELREEELALGVTRGDGVRAEVLDGGPHGFAIRQSVRGPHRAALGWPDVRSVMAVPEASEIVIRLSLLGVHPVWVG